MSIAIIADDLTGACDTAIQLKSSGNTVQVFWRLPEQLEADILALHTSSRSVTGSAAYERVYEAVRHLNRLGVTQYYKKIDSLFRGNVVRETEAVMDALSIDLAVVAPAAPANDRIFINGAVRSQALNRTVPVLDMYRGGNNPFALIPLSVVRQGDSAVWAAMEHERGSGAKVLLFDSETDADLASIAGACGMLRHRFLPVGTLGFIRHLKEYWGLSTSDCETTYSRNPGTLLYVAGTCNPVTAGQFEALAQTCEPVLICSEACVNGQTEQEISRVLACACERMAQKPKELLLAVDSIKYPAQRIKALADPNGNISCPVITETVSQVAAALIRRFHFSGVVLTGGDTAQGVFDYCGVAGITLSCEIIPGIAAGTALFGENISIPVVTKSGGFGERDAFLKVMQFFEQEHTYLE